jgi:hypothetical protein
VAEELQELKDRLADLSSSVDELIARQRTQQPADPAPPPPVTPET